MTLRKRIFGGSLAGLALCALAFSACSMDVPPHSGSGLHIALDDSAAKAAEHASSFDLMSGLLKTGTEALGILATGPTTIGDFSCFAVNVTGSGISGSSTALQNCTSSTNMHGVGIGLITDTLPTGSTFDVTVPASQSATDLRTVDVYGVYPPTQTCGGTNTSSGGGGGYFLGRVAQLVTQDTSITVPISYSGAAADVLCTGGNNGLNLTKSAFPNGGRDSGGWSFTVFGKGFTSGVTIFSLVNSANTIPLSCTVTDSNDATCTLGTATAGSRTGTYDIKADNQNGTSITSTGNYFQLTGSSTAFVSVDQNTSNISFGSITNNTSTPITMTLANQGDTTSGAINTSPTFSDASFSVANTDCGTNLTSGGTCKIVVQFAPTTQGSHTSSNTSFGVFSATFNGTSL